MISVCMATYNGAKYLKEQIDSILFQLGESDELIISDDSSTDGTVEILETYLIDSRVHLLLNNTFRSPVYNFEYALKNARGDIIILSDQDDIWNTNRVKKIVELFNLNSDIWLILNNYSVINAEGRELTHFRHTIGTNILKTSFLTQIVKNPYIGCCMSFKKELLQIALPFPQNLPMHDIWIGLLGSFYHKCLYCEIPLIRYRRHGNNVTTGKSPYSIAYRIYFRIILLLRIILRVLERTTHKACNHYK